MGSLDMKHEPIRLPAWAATLLAVVVLPLVVSLLSGIDWRDALATAVGAVIPLLAAAEVARSRVDSPATVELRLDQISRLKGSE